MRAPGIKRGRRAAPATLFARLGSHVTLEARTSGEIAACFGGFSVSLGKFSASAAELAQGLRRGLPLSSFASPSRNVDKEIHLLVRRLAGRGLLEYHLGRSPNGKDQIVIEPQVPDYWPRAAQLREADAVVLSRFAYMRRRANDIVLELPRAGALFKICNPKIAAALAMLSTPQQIRRLRRHPGFPEIELLALLVDCQILFKTGAAGGDGLRPAEGDDSLVLWDFHDLLFHARSTEGRHANPLGGAYPYVGVISPLPAVRPNWPGKKIDLRKFSDAHPEAISSAAKLLRERHSIREFDDQRPITLGELARFLDGAARVQSEWQTTLDAGDSYAARPYPSAGASYELELYLAVDKCEGLPRRILSYDAGQHALVPIDVRAKRARSAVEGSQVCNGRTRRAPDPGHDCRALWQNVMEVQLDRLCAYSEGRRRIDANVLPDGD